MRTRLAPLPLVTVRLQPFEQLHDDARAGGGLDVVGDDLDAALDALVADRRVGEQADRAALAWRGAGEREAAVVRVGDAVAVPVRLRPERHGDRRRDPRGAQRERVRAGGGVGRERQQRLTLRRPAVGAEASRSSQHASPAATVRQRARPTEKSVRVRARDARSPTTSGWSPTLVMRQRGARGAADGRLAERHQVVEARDRRGRASRARRTRTARRLAAAGDQHAAVGPASAPRRRCADGHQAVAPPGRCPPRRRAPCPRS